MPDAEEEPIAGSRTGKQKSEGDSEKAKRASCCTRSYCKRLWWGQTTTTDLVLPAELCSKPSSGKYTWLFYVRMVLFLWTLAIIIAQLAVDQNWDVYFCFMTMWGWWCLMVHLLLTVIVTIRYVPGRTKDRLDCLEKACFVTFSLCATFAIMVTLLYWILLFEESHFDEPADWVFGINNHALNLGIAALNFFASRIVPRYIHVVFSFAVASLYVAANAACSLSNGEDVYSVLPWNEPTTMTIVISIGGVLVGCIIFFFLIGLAFLRDKTCGRRSKSTGAPAMETEPKVEAQTAEESMNGNQISLT